MKGCNNFWVHHCLCWASKPQGAPRAAQWNPAFPREGFAKLLLTAGAARTQFGTEAAKPDVRWWILCPTGIKCACSQRKLLLVNNANAWQNDTLGLRCVLWGFFLPSQKCPGSPIAKTFFMSCTWWVLWSTLLLSKNSPQNSKYSISYRKFEIILFWSFL